MHKMRYYRYRPNANDFAGIGFAKVDNERIVDVHYTDTPLADSWAAPIAHGFEDESKLEGDFPSLNNLWRLAVASQRAWNILRPLVGYCCEALPIVHPTGNPYFIIHVMETIDCLDVAQSTFSHNATTGRINRVYHYVFKHENLHGKHIFKLPLECGSEMLVDDDFRGLVESNNLIGLQFDDLECRE
jgi:hypothetical protein